MILIQRISLLLYIALAFTFINASPSLAQAAKSVAVVMEPKIQTVGASSEQIKKFQEWVTTLVEDSLKKSEKLELRDLIPKKKNAKPAKYVVLSTLTIISHDLTSMLSKKGMKVNEPCSISFDMRLVQSGNSAIIAASNARNDKAKWPGAPKEQGEIGNSKLGKIVAPLVQKASRKLAKGI